MAVKERKFTKVESTTGGKSAEEKKELRQKNAGPFRIGALILWLLGIVCEVAAICLLKEMFFLPGSSTTWAIVFIVVDLVLVIVGALLWKHSNRIDPISKKNGVKFFFWNQLGPIIALLAFAPLIIFLLTNKDLDPKQKKLLTAVAAVALVVASAASIDYNPVSEEELLGAESVFSGETVYWTPSGHKYHIDADCPSLLNSAEIFTGTIDGAIEAGRTEPCKRCTANELNSRMEALGIGQPTEEPAEAEKPAAA